MLTLETIESAVQDVAPKYDIEKIALFGSYAKGIETSSSDIDIILETGNRFSLFDAVRIKNELKERLGIEVDVVSRRALYEPIAENIIKSQVLLYER